MTNKRYEIRKNENKELSQTGVLYAWECKVNWNNGTSTIAEFETFEEAIAEMNSWENEPAFLK